MDYAEDLIKLKEHLQSLHLALLHKNYEEVPTIVKAMKMRLGNVDGWITAAASKVSE